MAVPTPHSRRLFLRAALRAASGSALTLTLPAIMTACAQANQARLNGAAFQTLSAREAAEFDAIASRIIPGDDSPGAKEAGVIYFIDNVLGSEQDTLSLLREGLEELQSRTSSLHGTASFYNLSPVQQDSLLTDIEQTPFFGTIRFLSIAGMFSLPEYGGNRDNVGYRLIGFEDRHVWTPPFGYYDSDYQQRGQ